MQFTKKDILDMESLSVDEINLILDTADKMKEIRPDIAIVLCTGYSEKFTRQHAADMGIETFLKKPLVMQDLASTVRQALTAN